MEFQILLSSIRQKIGDLQDRLQGEDLPKRSAFRNLENALRSADSLCPDDMESELVIVKSEYSDVREKAKAIYLERIEQTLQDESGIGNAEIKKRVEGWIDEYGKLFDPGTARKMREQFDNQWDKWESKRQFEITKVEVNRLWRRAEAEKVPDRIIQNYGDAETTLKNYQQKMLALGADPDIFKEFDALLVEASKKHSDARTKFRMLKTNDQMGEFEKVITPLEGYADSDPTQLVAYYENDDLDSPEPEKLIPAKQALEVAKRREKRFTLRKVNDYFINAEKLLKKNDPKGARQALDFGRLNLSVGELLEDKGEEIGVGSEQRAIWRNFYKDLQHAEMQLQLFHKQVAEAKKIGDLAGWVELITIAKNYPKFIEHDKEWGKTMSEVFTSYAKYLHDELEEGRLELSHGNYDGCKKLLDALFKKVQFDIKLSFLDQDSKNELQSCLDVADRLSTITVDIQAQVENAKTILKRRQRKEIEELEGKLKALSGRLESEGIPSAEDGIPAQIDITNLTSQVLGLLSAEQKIAELRGYQDEQDIERLQNAIQDAVLFSANVPKEYENDLTDLVAHLNARLALLVGLVAKNTDLQQARKNLLIACKHPLVSEEAKPYFEEVEKLIAEDRKVKDAIEHSEQEPDPYKRWCILNKVKDAPTMDRQRFAKYYAKARNRCIGSLKHQLKPAVDRPLKDVDNIQKLLTQLEQVDASEADSYRQKLEPKIADYRAHLAAAKGKWKQASDYWRAAAQVDLTYRPYFLAANKHILILESQAALDPENIAAKLEQFMSAEQDLSDDPDLFFYLAQAKLVSAQDIAFRTGVQENDLRGAEQYFYKSMQAAEQGKIACEHWRSTQPQYETIRRELLQESGTSVISQTDLAKILQELFKFILDVKTMTHRWISIADGLSLQDESKAEKDYFFSVSGARRLYSRKHEKLKEWVLQFEKGLSSRLGEADGTVDSLLTRFQGFIEKVDAWWGETREDAIDNYEEEINRLEDENQVSWSGGPAPLTNEQDKKVWREIELRLCILVLDKENLEGRKVLSHLLQYVSNLMQKLSIELENTTGEGFGSSVEASLDDQVEHNQYLFRRKTVVSNALLYLQEEQFPTLGDVSWGEQKEDLDNRTRNYHDYFRDLLTAQMAFNQSRAALPSADSTGRYEELEKNFNNRIDNRTYTYKFTQHNTVIWFQKEIKRHEEQRKLFEDLVNDALCYLNMQDLEVLPWKTSLPKDFPDRDQACTSMALKKIDVFRSQAHSPVEVRSLLEEAWLLTQRFKQEYLQEDTYNLEGKWKWENTPNQLPVSGWESVFSRVEELLCEIVRSRYWLWPVIGGVPPKPLVNCEEVQVPEEFKDKADRIRWKDVCEKADQLRRSGNLLPACQVILLAVGKEQVSTPLPEAKQYISTILGLFTLEESKKYLKEVDPYRSQPDSGMARFLAKVGRQETIAIEGELIFADIALETLSQWEKDYQTHWKTLNARLKEFKQVGRWKEKPLIGQLFKPKFDRSGKKAFEAYCNCCRICPEHPNLIAQSQKLSEYRSHCGPVNCSFVNILCKVE